MKPTLYHYWRSSSSWRVRFALAHKGIPFKAVHVGLLDGEVESPPHLRRNPAAQVPVLEVRPGVFLTESVAICEYLEEEYPDRPLLPKTPLDRAYVRALMETINSGTQPLQNLDPMQMAAETPEGRKAWAQHWIRRGLSVYERLIARPVEGQRPGFFSLGESLTLADVFLIPQCYNAERFEVSLDAFPRIAAIQKHVLELPACATSHPERFQPPESA